MISHFVRNDIMKNILIIILSMIFFQGCISEKRCNRRYPPQVTKTDSVYVKFTETVRDTVIKVAADSSQIQMMINCDSLNQAYLSRIISYESGSNAMIPEVIIKDRILTVKCRVDSMAVYAKLKDRFTEMKETHDQVTVKIEKVNELTWWQQTQLILFKVLAAVIIVFLLYKNINKILFK